MNAPARPAQAWAAISEVTDPELDQSVTELGFITAFDVNATRGDVRVAYRLPTYWCAANFAFMMGHDMAERLGELAWTQHVSVRLLDHFYADEINRGLADNASFQDTCGHEASGGLAELRATFRYKAFMSRQERLMGWLLAHGVSRTALVAWTVADLAAHRFTEARGEHLCQRYLAMRRSHTPGDFSGHGYRGDGREIAFVTAAGKAIAADDLDAHRRHIQSIRMNSEFNATLCSRVLAVRQRETAAQDNAGGPARVR